LETTNGFGLGVVCALGSALTWAVVSLLARNLSDQFNSITINAIRSTLGGGIVLSLVLLQGGGAALLTLSPPVIVFLALSVLVAVGVGDTLFFEGTRTLGVAVAMTVSMSYPLITALLAVLLMGETLTLRLALGILLTLGGLALIVTGGKSPEADRSDRSRFGLVAASVAAVAWAAAALKFALERRAPAWAALLSRRFFPPGKNGKESEIPALQRRLSGGQPAPPRAVEADAEISG